jgi:uncharacterized protein (DUF1501 family)
MTYWNSCSRTSRRDWLRLAAAGVGGVSLSGWLGVLARTAAADPERKRACILLWMSGGPSQHDTYDLKCGHANGGPYKEIATRAPGIRISEHLPQLAAHADRMAIIRSMKTREGDHGRATYHLRTGYLQQGPIHYPPVGALLAKELGDASAELPNFISIAPAREVNSASYGAGFLGPQYAPLVVDGGPPGANAATLKVQDLPLAKGIRPARAAARMDLLGGLERNFVARFPGEAPRSHQSAYERAGRLMRTTAAKAFNLDEEPGTLRDAYGRNRFGQGCLLARRLVERGVPFVEVTLGGWDTHIQNFDLVRPLSQTLDAAWSTLMTDLRQRGLLDSTLIVWMGEFGRTPQINGQNGRDHFPSAWTTVLAGGGIKGGQVIGRTSRDGTAVEDYPVSVPNFLATVCRALGVDPTKQNQSNVGRPIRIADAGAQPIKEVLA